MSEIRTRKPASNERYCIRRIPPTSSHWFKGPPAGMTSGAFSDPNSETSIDLWDECLDEAGIMSVNVYRELVESKGAGYAICQAGTIRTALKGKNIEGDVLEDPVSDNDRHGVITGKDNRPKRRCLAENFSFVIEPKQVSEMFPAPNANKT